MLSVSPQTIMSSWEFRKSAIPCRSSGCSSKTTIRVFTGCFSEADIYVRVRGLICGLLFAIPAAQMSSREFCQVLLSREHGERREVVVRRFPRPRFTQISFNPEKRELRQHFLPACFPYLICGNLRNRADGTSEIEGKAARGRRASWETSEFQSRKGISEIEDKGAMVSAEQGGSRASFNLRISQSPRPSCALW